MPIPESQLETWSHQGAVTTSSATYRSIQAALTANSSPIKGKDFEVYLQGSYKNDTNIRGDSDVDVVVQLNEAFYRDLSALAENQKRLYEASHSSATYLWADFRKDVLQALRAYYGGSKVSEGNRSLKLAADAGRLAADIVPALHFRKYEYFYSLSDQGFIDGIKFFNRPNNREIINFPKPHHANGVAKHSAGKTNGWYKPTVRIFKNARTYLVDHGSLSGGVAPSYFLECMVYNVPDGAFGKTFQDTFAAAWNWMRQAKASTFVCQNEQLPLFGNAPENWDALKANQLLDALKDLWENW